MLNSRYMEDRFRGLYDKDEIIRNLIYSLQKLQIEIALLKSEVVELKKEKEREVGICVIGK